MTRPIQLRKIKTCEGKRKQSQQQLEVTKMAPNLSEDEIDDLLYFARTGDASEFETLKAELCKREGVSEVQLLEAARDEESGNGILHMAAANGHSGICPSQ